MRGVRNMASLTKAEIKKPIMVDRDGWLWSNSLFMP